MPAFLPLPLLTALNSDPAPPGESTDGCRLLEDFPVVALASGLIIHQLDLPVPSFCVRMNRL